MLGQEIRLPASFAPEPFFETGELLAMFGQRLFEFTGGAGFDLDRFLERGTFRAGRLRRLFALGDGCIERGQFSVGGSDRFGERRFAFADRFLFLTKIGEPAFEPIALGNALLASRLQGVLLRFDRAAGGGKRTERFAGGLAGGQRRITFPGRSLSLGGELAQFALTPEHAALFHRCPAGHRAARSRDFAGEGHDAPATRQGFQGRAGGGEIINNQRASQQRPDDRVEFTVIIDQAGRNALNAAQASDIGRQIGIAPSPYGVERLEGGAPGTGSLQMVDSGFRIGPPFDDDILQMSAEGDLDRRFEAGRGLDQFHHRSANAVQLARFRGLLNSADALVEAGATFVQPLQGFEAGGELAQIALGGIDAFASCAFRVRGLTLGFCVAGEGGGQFR